jgi:hypothetical protein
MKHITQALMYVSQAVGILKAIRTSASIAMQHGEGFSAIRNGKELAIKALLEGKAHIDQAIEGLQQGGTPVEPMEKFVPLSEQELSESVADADVTGADTKPASKAEPKAKAKAKPKVKPKVTPTPKP